MSTSPPSTALRTPSSTPAPEPLSSTGRTGRVRKPIERFGSLVHPDQMYGDGDESDIGTAVEDQGDEDEDGDFAGPGGEHSDDEIGGQDDEDEDEDEDDKKRKKVAAVKKDKKTAATKKKSTVKESKTGASKKLAVGKKDKVVVELAAAKKKAIGISKAKPASSKPLAAPADQTRDSDKEEFATERTDDQTVKVKAKGKRQGIVLAKATKSTSTPTPKTPLSAKAVRRPMASEEKKADGKTATASPVKPIVIGAKSAKSRPGIQLAAAKKPAVTIAPTPAQSDDDSDNDSAQVSAAKAKIRSRAGTPAVTKLSQATGSGAEPSKEQEHSEASDVDDEQPETQLPTKNKKAINTKNPKSAQQKNGKRSLAERSDETDDDNQDKISKESLKGSDADSDGDALSEAASMAFASPDRETSMDRDSEGARVSKNHVSLSRSPSPDLIATTTSKSSKKRKTTYEESQAPAATQRATGDESEDGEMSEDENDKSSDSQPSKTTSTPTPKKAKRKTVTSSDRDDGSSSTPSKKSKPAPAEKILPEHRVAIIQAFVDKSYLPALNFGAVSRLLAESGVDCTAAKLGRHWREVLSSDIKQHVEGSMSNKATKGKKGGGIGMDERQAIWVEVVKHYEKADWKKLEKESGVSTTKLKRHLRDVLDKDVKKFISQ